MLDLILKPVSLSQILPTTKIEPNQWGRSIDFFDGQKPALEKYDIAILGIGEERHSKGNEGCALAPDAIREQLYKLYKSHLPLNIIDLGNIHPGKTVKDTYFGLASILHELLKNNVITVILGGSHDLTYAHYLGYQELYELINLVVIDQKVDIWEVKDHEINSESYLLPIFIHQPNYLFNYSHIGYQSYLTDCKAIEILEGLSFDCHRLGDVKSNLELVEPIIRDADMLSIDISAIRQSDAPGHEYASPNGFFGEDLCQIARYAGYSDKVTSLGIYEVNPSFDVNNQTTQLAAQTVWHFVEGFYNRKGDFPESSKKDFMKYTVEFDGVDYQLIFWKSKKTDRWWMELPFGDKEKFSRQQLVPCSYADYKKACDEELPDRWMKAYHKLV